MTDLDLALAMQLQEEEAYDLHAFERNRPRGLVTTVTRFCAFASPTLLPPEPQEDQPPEQRQRKTTPPWKVRDKSLKGQGGTGEIITKHDLEKSGMRNAQRLSDTVDGCGPLSSPVSNGTANSLQHKLRRQERGGRAGSEDIQTLGKALDQKSRLILRKFIDSGVLDEVVCIVRTGKEAVVYRALGPWVIPKGAVGFGPGSSPDDDDAVLSRLVAEDDDDDDGMNKEQQRELCVKVYRTTLSLFRHRADYVVGDHRFDSLGDLNKLNQAKVVSVWAEKELKNLTRMFRAGLPCPEPIQLHRNVLVMSFIHTDGWGAPRLADVPVGQFKRAIVEDMCMQVVLIARAMLLRCKLVHADLSQFNVLYQNGRCYVIDVGQAVDTSHPNARELLTLDVKNVLAFFRLHGVALALDNALVEEWIWNGVVEPSAVHASAQRWGDYAQLELGDWADAALAVELGSRLSA